MDAEAQVKRVGCRLIADGDLDALAELLWAGFPERTRDYWVRALATLRARETPADYPRYGYLLEQGRDIVGVILLIFSGGSGEEGGGLRCNVSSWYVRPSFRSYAAMLISRALRFKHVTYLNISPAPHTWPILEAQGYSRYSDGLFVCAPALTPRSAKARVRRHDLASARSLQDVGLRDLLAGPVRQDCLIVSAEAGDEIAPFIFVPSKLKALKRGVLQLAYCRETSDFVRYAGPVGRSLLRLGQPLVVLDGRDPIPGLVGRYFRDRAPKYFKGPQPPRLNDLGYTEALLFGR